MLIASVALAEEEVGKKQDKRGIYGAGYGYSSSNTLGGLGGISDYYGTSLYSGSPYSTYFTFKFSFYLHI